MGIQERMLPKPMDKLESEIALFEAKKGRIDFKHGSYFGEHSSPEDQQPFISHVLFALTKLQDTSVQAGIRGESYRHIPKDRLGHLYHSFPDLDEAEELTGPQTYRIKIPEQKLWKLRQPMVTRMDLLTGAHLEGIESIEDMCVRAIALSTQRFLEGVPETLQDPSAYLIEKIV